MQLAKLAGNKVVATCGGKEKAKLLKDLGVDRVIDYKKENIKTVRNILLFHILFYTCINGGQRVRMWKVEKYNAL